MGIVTSHSASHPGRTAVAGGLLWGIFVAAVSLAGYLEALERPVLDTLLRLHIHARGEPRTVIVAIDDASLTALDHPWPFPRRFHADVIRNLTASSPAVIGLDVIFSEPSAFGRGDDEALADALAQAKNVVLPAAVVATREDVRPGTVERTWLLRPLQILRANAMTTGLAEIATDSDGIVRRIARTYTLDERPLPTFPAELHRIVAKRLGQPASLVETGDVLIDFRGGSGTIPRIPYHRVMRGQFAREAVAGKVVLIGATAPQLRDVARTPVDLSMPGVELIANAVETLLAGRPPRRFEIVHGLLVVAASVSAAALMARSSGFFWSATIATLGGLAPVTALSSDAGVATSLVAVVIAWFGGFAAAHAAQSWRRSDSYEPFRGEHEEG